MQIAGRLDARKDEWLEGGHEFLRACGGPYKHDSKKLQTFWSQSCGWKPRAAKVLRRRAYGRSRLPDQEVGRVRAGLSPSHFGLVWLSIVASPGILIMLSHLLAVASVWLVAAVSPGPNFLMTARIAVARSRGAGLAAVCGIGIATAIWGVCGLAGIKALFLAAPWAYAALKLAGAGYLIYSGLRLIVLAERRSEADGALAVDPRGFSTWRAFWIGLATSLANPRSALSVASIFAVALPAQPSLTLGVASVVLMVAISVGWYACVVWLFAAEAVSNGYRRLRRAIDRLAGGLLILFGAKLALERG
ncbi:MAG: LysE family translocator [Mesorhizobium sp.]|nr:MAG: LysE family translocator [Mesorhizobium sp.]RWG91502.1 MAG: LysE family translocator [Mesorhizobium sp.]RWK12804.1 MAG: LysE family translocator [Mesorhizobium sp.]RWK22638.1 MAG: LysE family translocator [Mesorhizobium sp.]TIQ46902.1 MAG: LysE family translocator [Mesorhizobium sp.]